MSATLRFLWVTIISVFCLVMLIITQDPFVNPGLSFFLFALITFVMTFALGRIFTGRRLLAFVFSFYSMTILLLLFLRIFTSGTFISSTLLFGVLAALAMMTGQKRII